MSTQEELEARLSDLGVQRPSSPGRRGKRPINQPLCIHPLDEISATKKHVERVFTEVSLDSNKNLHPRKYHFEIIPPPDEEEIPDVKQLKKAKKERDEIHYEMDVELAQVEEDLMSKYSRVQNDYINNRVFPEEINLYRAQYQLNTEAKRLTKAKRIQAKAIERITERKQAAKGHAPSVNKIEKQKMVQFKKQVNELQFWRADAASVTNKIQLELRHSRKTADADAFELTEIKEEILRLKLERHSKNEGLMPKPKLPKIPPRTSSSRTSTSSRNGNASPSSNRMQRNHQMNQHKHVGKGHKGKDRDREREPKHQEKRGSGSSSGRASVRLSKTDANLLAQSTQHMSLSHVPHQNTSHSPSHSPIPPIPSGGKQSGLISSSIPTLPNTQKIPKTLQHSASAPVFSLKLPLPASSSSPSSSSGFGGKNGTKKNLSGINGMDLLSIHSPLGGVHSPGISEEREYDLYV